MKGENTKITGTLGHYEIGAKWQWRFQSPSFLTSVCILSLSLVIVFFGCTLIWVHFTKLATKQEELQQVCLEVLRIQSEVKRELEEMKKFKEELAGSYQEYSSSLDNRVKRSISIENLAHSKSKDIKYSKRKNSTSQNSSVKHKTKNPLLATAIHLERNVPLYNTGSNGIINRWHPQAWLPSLVETIQLVDHNSSLVIPSTGLYLIYAQLCYAATKENNSFEVRLISHGATSSQSKIIAQCSAGTTVMDNDITCFTSIVQVLQAGDKIHLQQIQKNRHLLMSMGRSFMGAVKMSH